MRILQFFGPVALTLAVTPLAAGEQSSSPKPLLQGARDYADYGCAACHGTTGAGGGWQGPKLAPGPLPYDAFLAQLREPAAKMPRYSAEVLPDAQIEGIYAYLRSIPRGKKAADIGILGR